MEIIIMVTMGGLVQDPALSLLRRFGKVFAEETLDDARKTNSENSELK